MKIKFVINNKEKDYIIKKMIQSTILPIIKEEDIEIEYDDSHEPVFDLQSFDLNINNKDSLKEKPYFFINDLEGIITNCIDKWNGYDANMFEPRYALGYKNSDYSLWSRSANGSETLQAKGRNKEEAIDFIKTAPRR